MSVVRHGQPYYAAMGGFSTTMPRPKTPFVFTGEKRPPRAGEYFLSGAIVEVHHAMNDQPTPMHIARPMADSEIPPERIMHRGFSYRREPRWFQERTGQ